MFFSAVGRQFSELCERERGSHLGQCVQQPPRQAGRLPATLPHQVEAAACVNGPSWRHFCERPPATRVYKRHSCMASVLATFLNGGSTSWLVDYQLLFLTRLYSRMCEWPPTGGIFMNGPQLSAFINGHSGPEFLNGGSWPYG
jgi:hypothetical protein